MVRVRDLDGSVRPFVQDLENTRSKKIWENLATLPAIGFLHC
jgi:hypothetical protein